MLFGLSVRRLYRSALWLLATVALLGSSTNAFAAETVGGNGHGLGLSLAIGAGDSELLAYFDTGSNDLLFSEKIAGSWSTATVDSATTQPGATALVYQNGVPHIFYTDIGAGTLRHAYRNG